MGSKMATSVHGGNGVHGEKGHDGAREPSDVVAECIELLKLDKEISPGYAAAALRALPFMSERDAMSCAANFGRLGGPTTGEFNRKVLKARLLLGERFFWHHVQVGQRVTKKPIVTESAFKVEQESSRRVALS